MRMIPTVLLAGMLTASAAAQNAPPADPPARDPIAMSALDRMGNALRALKQFTITADVTDEDVLEDGQKLQYSGTIEVKADRPNRFRIDSKSDRKMRSIYYDGKSVTIFAPAKGYYATFPAPATISALIDKLDTDYGIAIPLADLFSWGTDQSQIVKVTSALPVGSDTINGTRCEHFAMRQEGVDWQIWIAQGATALPCKYVITSTDDPSMPQYVAVLRWDTSTPVPADTFAFTAPQGSQAITMGKTAIAARNTQ